MFTSDIITLNRCFDIQNGGVRMMEFKYSSNVLN